jgi:hypothetical protein
MKPIGRVLTTLFLASCAVMTLWLAFQVWAAPPSPVTHPKASQGPADGSLPLGEPITVYLPLVASTAVSATSPYTFPLPPNLPAIESLYPLTDSARARLRQHGFVILAGERHERLSSAYNYAGQHADVPIFVTGDAMLYLFHAVLNDLLKTIEKDALYTDTLSLVQALQTDSLAVYASVPPTQPLIRDAARHNVVVLAVARKLFEPDFAPPAEVAAEVLTYTRKISEHTAVEFYPGDDYTQYQPRGHYAGDAQLERYFRAIKWLGRRIYRIQDNQYPHEADVELVAAVLLAGMLQGDGAAQTTWQRVYDVTRLLCGPADSITPPMVSIAVSRTFGVSFTPALLEEGENRALLRDELLNSDDYPTSEIIPVPTLPGQMPLKYVQVMGERYLPDAEVMQETTYPHTGRALPSGLDVMAALLESDRADQLLANEKAQYPNLAAQLAALRAQFGGYTTTWWTRSTYNRWLYSLNPLLVSYNDEYPRFMRSAAWERKALNTALASWAHLRHDFILYGKQTYPTVGWDPGHGFVEPVPAFYTRLSEACHQISDTLTHYALLPEAHAHALEGLAARLDTFAGYAAKILAHQPLSEMEQDDIHNFGGWLDGFFAGWGVYEKTPITVADVASDANAGRVLHEGVGLFNPIVIIYEPPDGTALAGLGYVMSYYEFALPGWVRLTDAEWRTQVISGTPPARPWWVVDLLDFEEARER